MTFDRNSDRIADLSGRLEQANRDTKAQRDQIRKLKRQNQNLQSAVQKKNQDLDVLNKKLQVVTTPSERKKLERRVKDLKGDLARERSKNAATLKRNNDRIRELQETLDNGIDDDAQAERKEIQDEIERLQQENERLEERNEEIFSRMPLNDKVKYIFKMYGVTVIGVLAAVGSVIGVIISNLKAGSTKVAKGVGELGKKLGQIVPGMVGALVSFLFKAAGEAVGFLAKHVWLLILLVVTLVVEEFKNKSRRKK